MVVTRAKLRIGAARILIVPVLLLHCSAVLLYALHDRHSTAEDFWAIWAGQVSVLITISATLFGVAALLRNRASQTVLIALQLLLYLVGIYGEASFPLPLFSWGTALLIEAQLLFQPRRAVVFSIGMASLAVFLPRAASVWDVDLDRMRLVDRLAAANYYSVVVLLLCAYKRLRFQAESDNRSKALLQESLVRLITANVGYQDYAVSAERKAAWEERHRITREIHDTLGYTLTNLVMMTKAAEELIDHDHELLRGLLTAARKQCQESMAETRRTLRSLWAMKAPELMFSKQLWKTVRTFEIATGIDVQIEFRNLPQLLSGDIREILHRTLQEGLTNSFRHGRATQVTVLFWYDGSEISIVIRDDGIGNPKFQEDIGIGGMRERFESAGGRVSVRSPHGGGFEIRAWVPVNEQQCGAE